MKKPLAFAAIFICALTAFGQQASVQIKATAETVWLGDESGEPVSMTEEKAQAEFAGALEALWQAEEVDLVKSWGVDAETVRELLPYSFEAESAREADVYTVRISNFSYTEGLRILERIVELLESSDHERDILNKEGERIGYARIEFDTLEERPPEIIVIDAAELPRR